MRKIYPIFIFLFLLCCSSTEKTTTRTTSFVPPSQKKTKSSEVKIKTSNKNKSKKTESNYRIQIFASSSFEIASKEKEKAEGLDVGNVYIENIDGLWKVRVGDFFNREEAQKVRNFLSGLGWKGAWVVDLKNEGRSKQPKIIKKIYQIQILASNDKSEAEELQKNLKILGFKESYLVVENGIWKVRIGRFTNKTEAERELKKIRELGFEDSWIYEK
ncbi:hypothetical protein DRQ09_05255 [candidate division KSB1 bacterium]|nr:MAG: hypothetical protein DRQ09_05255 [candidate division KSB1 bacterium]